ncbi:MAG: hypothetical protein U0793_25510 [Gemmataceae bacterium]
MTFFPQPNKGFWTMGEALFQDEIVIDRVLAKDARLAKRFLAKLKRWLKEKLEQEDILIIQRTVDVLD